MFTKHILVAVQLILILDSIHALKNKRDVYGGYDNNGFHTYSNSDDLQFRLPAPSLVYSKPILSQKFHHTPSISSAQIASAIQAAKEASAAVISAQHRVQEAKEALLTHQHLANHKEAAATLAQQKAEAAAAVQRQEAKSAATAVVMAQQRLAKAKAEVAEQQKIAATKEAHAAIIIQKSAAAAEAEIEKSDHVAEKISARQHSDVSAVKHAAVSKDLSLSAASAAIAASSGHPGFHHVPFYHTGRIIHFGPWQ